MANSTTDYILRDQDYESVKLTQKIMLRWYLTPYSIDKFSPHAPHASWRNCGAVGTLYHILWSCHVITISWKRVFQLLTQVLKITLPMSPGLALLSLTIHSVPPRRQNDSRPHPFERKIGNYAPLERSINPVITRSYLNNSYSLYI